jgi:hypothetical protein
MRPLEGRKRKWGDRYDGYRVRNLDPMTMLIPFIMKTNSDSWVLFEDDVEITATQDFIFKARKGELPGLTLYHVIFGAIARAMAELPELNRFVINRRVYARNEIKGSMVVMKGMSKESERSIITPRFELEDTLKDIVRKIQEQANPIKEKEEDGKDQAKNSFEVLERLLCILPGWLLKSVINLIYFLDNRGWLPKSVNALSPFHSSFFITNMGSIGIAPVYHHIYELGTLSVFGAIGGKEVRHVTDEDGNIIKKLFVKLRFVVDERATDGFIYAEGFRLIRKYIMKPELLMKTSEKIRHDVIDRVRA